MYNRMQALVLALIGLLLASPLPSRAFSALSPQKADADGHVFTQAADRSWMHFVEFLGPWSRVAGIGVAAFCAIWTVFKAGEVYMKPRWPRTISYAVAACIGVVTALMTVLNPPQIGGAAHDIGSTLRRAADGTRNETGWQDGGRPAGPSPSPTPSSDGTSWSSTH